MDYVDRSSFMIRMIRMLTYTTSTMVSIQLDLTPYVSA